MEKQKARKIKKWDEVHGEYEVEVSDGGGCDPEEAAFHQQKSHAQY